MKAKTIDLTEIAQIQDRLRTAPSRPETRVRYVKAIEIMASEIHAMRSKGYSWSDIAVVLTDNGLQVSATRLRAYFNRVASDASHPPRRGAHRHREPVRAMVPLETLATPRSSSLPSTRDTATKIEKTAKPSSATTLPTVPVPVAATSTPPLTPSAADAETTPRWSFAVRPDTPDL